MDISVISQEITQLPVEGQREVLDFVVFLKSRFKAVKPVSQKGSITEESFVGMWKNNEAITDSSSWVRGTREKEWAEK